VLQKIGYAGYAKRWTMSSNGRSLYAHIGNAVLGASEIRVLDSSKEVIGLTGDDVTIMFNQ
jgi:hypothetical protein